MFSTGARYGKYYPIASARRRSERVEVVSDVSASVKRKQRVVVTSWSVFPDLVSFKVKFVKPVQRQTRLAVRQIGLSCGKFVESLPQFEVCVFAAMLILAIA